MVQIDDGLDQSDRVDVVVLDDSQFFYFLAIGTDLVDIAIVLNIVQIVCVLEENLFAGGDRAWGVTIKNLVGPD